jgi:uncharacterized damage-inducible protein DinB
MTHLLITQIRFTRSEFARGLEGVNPQDALRRVPPMNCISWIIGHLANQENLYWVRMAQGEVLFPELNALVGYGKPASTPPLDEMLATWQAVTAHADRYLDALTAEELPKRFDWKGKPIAENIGTLLLRNIYHYWFHLGEAQGIRQALGHTNLPEYVGDMSRAIYYRE